MLTYMIQIGRTTYQHKFAIHNYLKWPACLLSITKDGRLVMGQELIIVLWPIIICIQKVEYIKEWET